MDVGDRASAHRDHLLYELHPARVLVFPQLLAQCIYLVLQLALILCQLGLYSLELSECGLCGTRWAQHA